jgi:hypothetical protein
VQRDRLADSVARNPDVVNTKKEFQLRTRETGLYLSIFGSGLSGLAPKEYVGFNGSGLTQIINGCQIREHFLP